MCSVQTDRFFPLPLNTSGPDPEAAPAESPEGGGNLLAQKAYSASAWDDQLAAGPAPQSPPQPAQYGPKVPKDLLEDTDSIIKEGLKDDRPKANERLSALEEHLAKTIGIRPEILRNSDPKILDAALDLARYPNLNDNEKYVLMTKLKNIEASGNGRAAMELRTVVNGYQVSKEYSPGLMSNEELKERAKSNRVMASLIDGVPGRNAPQFVFLKLYSKIYSQAAEDQETLLKERLNSLPW